METVIKTNTQTSPAQAIVTIESLEVVPHGPKPAPVVINDKVRGRVHLLSKPNEPFRAWFQMKAGQIRGCAYHSIGHVVFELLEGSYVFMSADSALGNKTVRQVDAPARIDIPAGICHLFVPITDGIIIETADAPTGEFLAKVIRKLEEFKPYVEQIKKEIEAGKYKAPKDPFA